MFFDTDSLGLVGEDWTRQGIALSATVYLGKTVHDLCQIGVALIHKNSVLKVIYFIDLMVSPERWVKGDGGSSCPDAF